MKKHATPTKNAVRGHHAPFITESITKAVYSRSRLKTKFIKNHSEMNKKLYKRQLINVFQSGKKSIKQNFSNITSKDIVTNREFWKTMKLFVTKKVA